MARDRVSLMGQHRSEQPAVLVVVHGSRNKEWVAQQRHWFTNVRTAMSDVDPRVVMELSFLEITEPLFEDQFRAMSGRHSHVIILPFFLVQGSHVMKDIPDIATRGLAPGGTYELLRADGFAALLGANAEERLLAGKATPADDVIACGYGSSRSNDHWHQLVADVRDHAGMFRDQSWHWAATGHYLPDNAAPLRGKIEALRKEGKTHLAILPLYLGISSYQTDLIPRIMNEFSDVQFHFSPTSILPDQRLEKWAVEAITQALHSRSATR
ncbi:CbiX/SirB N-terminal domain-containing protein [Candidatus Sumerlaeota bacterium]|nr:CbiX/SirB N-terminal domain-containing protein [Candidatus Sumerlaeota bacterium]